jgi:hypothetical protein
LLMLPREELRVRSPGSRRQSPRHWSIRVLSSGRDSAARISLMMGRVTQGRLSHLVVSLAKQ